MIDALRYEWTRLRTLRSTYWLIGLGILVTAGIATILSIAIDESDSGASTVLAILTGGIAGSGGEGLNIPFIAVFMAIIGIFTTGHEYRHGTIQPTLTTIPQRSTLLTAKIIVLVVTTALVLAVSLAINYAIGTIVWGELDGVAESPLDEAVPGYVAYTLLYALLGLTLGLLFRGVPSALVVLFVFPLVIETLIFGLSFVDALDWLVPVVKFLPFTAGSMMMQTDEVDFGSGAPDFDFFDRWASGGIFAAWIALILAAAWYLFKKRDA
jgi:ABC-2 type transport system permease protein